MLTFIKLNYLVKKVTESRARKINTSFGQLVMGDELSFPNYSIGKAKRKFALKDGIGLTPGPQYNINTEGSSQFAKVHY